MFPLHVYPTPLCFDQLVEEVYTASHMEAKDMREKALHAARAPLRRSGAPTAGCRPPLAQAAAVMSHGNTPRLCSASLLRVCIHALHASILSDCLCQSIPCSHPPSPSLSARCCRFVDQAASSHRLASTGLSDASALETIRGSHQEAVPVPCESADWIWWDVHHSARRSRRRHGRIAETSVRIPQKAVRHQICDE